MKQKRYIIFVLLAFLGVYWPVPEIRANHGTHVDGTINTSKTWTFANSPYIVTSDVMLATGGTLTIEAGVVVKFEAGRQLHSGAGKIIANGTANDPIVFTSITDDDTSDWYRIVLGNDQDSVTHAEIRYANFCFWVSSASPTIKDNIIRNCGYGIDFSSASSAVIQNNTIRNNARGLRFLDDSGVTFSNNNIYSNSQFGAENQTPEQVVTANGNWWGHVNGPCLPADQPACTNKGDKITSGFTVESFLKAEVGSSSSSSSWTPPFSGGGGGGQNSPASIPPRILKFEASSPSFKEGEQGVILSWETQATEYISLVPELVEGPLSGSLKVRPEETTVYKLVALGPGGEVSQELKIEALPRDPVIIVPGILGSWRGVGDITKPSLDPFLHSYDGLWEGLKSVGYIEGKTLFALPYDWRKDNRETARLLRRKIDKILQICQCDKVDIVTHSMGGLVARYYIQNIDNQTIDQLIFLGTPHLGATVAYLSWEAGERGVRSDEKLMARILDLEALSHGYLDEVRYIQNHILSVKQLLPVYDYIYSSYNWFTTKEIFGYEKCKQDLFPCNEFLEGLAEAKPQDLGIKVYNIVSESEKTLKELIVQKDPREAKKWKHGKPLNYDKEDGLVFDRGDGTVPLYSAEWIGHSMKINGEHRLIPYNAQSEISKILINKEIKNFGRTPLKRLLFIGIKSPADITVTTPSGKVYGAGVGDDGWAFYSGTEDPEFITIPDPEDGDFVITVTGTGQGGKFGLEATLLADEREDGISYEGEIAPGQQMKFTLTHSGEGAKLLQMKILDLMPPETTLLLDGEQLENGYAPGLVAILNAKDNSGGEMETLHSIDDGESWLKYDRELKFDSIGEYRVLYKSIDKSGNTEPVKVARFAVVPQPASTVSTSTPPETITSSTSTPSSLAPGGRGEGEGETGQVKGQATKTAPVNNKRSTLLYTALILIMLSIAGLAYLIFKKQKV